MREQSLSIREIEKLLICCGLRYSKNYGVREVQAFKMPAAAQENDITVVTSETELATKAGTVVTKPSMKSLLSEVPNLLLVAEDKLEEAKETLQKAF